MFRSGEDGYHTFRIPAVVQAANGDLLAFCEGRVKGSGDGGNIDLVMRRSADGGATWGKLVRIADNGDGVFGNPAPVVDRKSGDVVLLMVLQDGASHEGQILRGEAGERTPYVMHSADHGVTWSEPKSLEATCDRDTWGWYATGPCHGIQLNMGPHAGRMVVPANHSSLPHGGGRDAYGAHLLLSDDGGKTWRIGAVADSHLGEPELNPNESCVAELEGGSLYMNSRDQGGTGAATRAHGWSDDGGETLRAPLTAAKDLVAPVCQGSLLSHGERLLFCAPSKPNSRERLAVRVSDDRGKSWAEALVIDPGQAAYSDLVGLGEGRFGVLYEAGGYAEILFAPFSAERFAKR